MQRASITDGDGCTGVILAGGASRRFGGGAKGLARIGDCTIVERVARALAEACDDLLVVANDVRVRSAIADLLPSATIIADERDAGPLAGVHAALHHAGRAILVLAWDMPFMNGGLLRALRARGQAAGVSCIPASNDDGRLEPLCAWYPHSVLPVATALLDRGELRIGALADAAPIRIFSCDDASRFGDPAVLFANVNDAESLAAARHIAASPGSATSRDRDVRRVSLHSSHDLDP